jgi:hypothetical protein
LGAISRSSDEDLAARTHETLHGVKPRRAGRDGRLRKRFTGYNSQNFRSVALAAYCYWSELRSTAAKPPGR